MARTCYAPVFKGATSSQCALKIIAYILALIALYLLWVILLGADGIKCLIKKTLFRISNCLQGNTDTTIDLNFNLDQWLKANSNIANAIIWRPPSGPPKAYPKWSASEKSQLSSTYWQIRKGESMGLPAAPSVTLNKDNSGQVWATELSTALAWKYYLAYVAHVIAAEVRKWLSWSVTGYTQSELGLLLDSKSLFEWGLGPQKHLILKHHHTLFSHGAVTPGDAGRTFGFLFKKGLISSTSRDTIENLLEWCRNNLAHFAGNFAPDNLYKYWQYKGYPPVEKIISGTVSQDFAYLGIVNWTAGCWGTVGFLRAVLRTVNIPVTLENPKNAEHALPYFVRDKVYLSHGDDPYNAFSKATPPFPVGELFINQTKYNAWFGPSVSPAAIEKNFGRRTLELAIKYLPDLLLKDHCDDLAAGKNHAQSKVYVHFKDHYTVKDLEAKNLWSNMNTKIANFGGCNKIP